MFNIILLGVCWFCFHVLLCNSWQIIRQMCNLTPVNIHVRSLPYTPRIYTHMNFCSLTADPKQWHCWLVSPKSIWEKNQRLPGLHLSAWPEMYNVILKCVFQGCITTMVSAHHMHLHHYLVVCTKWIHLTIIHFPPSGILTPQTVRVARLYTIRPRPRPVWPVVW